MNFSVAGTLPGEPGVLVSIMPDPQFEARRCSKCFAGFQPLRLRFVTPSPWHVPAIPRFESHAFPLLPRLCLKTARIMGSCTGGQVSHRQEHPNIRTLPGKIKHGDSYMNGLKTRSL